MWDCPYKYYFRFPSSPNKQIASPIRGFVDDYAFLVRALLDLYEATLDPEWMAWAAELQQRQDQLFWDQDGGEGDVETKR